MSIQGLNIGLQGLLTAQASLDTIGHNVTNANTPGYSRQSLDVSTAPTSRIRNLLMGNGVQADVVRRTVDGLLNNRLIQQTAGVRRLEAALQTMQQAEGFFGSSSNTGLAKLMEGFFGSLSSLSATPEDPVLRSGAVQSATQLASQFNSLATNLDVLRHDTLSRLDAHVDRVNELAKQISDLNKQIVATESANVQANDLRDRRDHALTQLAELVDVRVFDDPRGASRVLVGGTLLVSPTTYNRLELVDDAQGRVGIELDGQSTAVQVVGGAIGGLLGVVNDVAPKLERDIDELAANWILEFNRVHATGVGANGPFRQLTATNSVLDQDGDGVVVDELLSNSGLPFAVGTGQLLVNVTDLATGAVEQHPLTIDAARTTVQDLIDDLNAIGHLTASLDGQGKLHVFAEPGFGFDFSKRLDPDPNPIGSFGGGQASIASSGSEPFTLVDGDTLDLTGPAGSFSVAFDSTDFAQIGQATADELAAVINADPNAQANGLIANVVAGHLVVQTVGSGAGESFTVDGGSALAQLGWTAGAAVAGSDIAVAVSTAGPYTGAANDRWIFRPNQDGIVGTTAGLKLLVFDQSGAQIASLDVGAGYNPGDELDVLDGVRIEVGYGALSATDQDLFALRVTADSDTSDILPALGLNALFSGHDAATIGVRDDIEDDHALLATSLDGAPGDGTVLLELLQLDERAIGGLGSTTFGQRFGDVVSTLGLQIRSNDDAREAEQFLLDSLQARRDQTSGVNVDEELVHLIASEQAFNAASQFIRVAAQTSEELMNLLR